MDEGTFAHKAVRCRHPPQPLKPGPAVRGARVLLCCLVWFNHIGFTNSRRANQMRNNAGFTITGFFLLLGFTMTSSVPANGIPLSDLRDFWVSRIGPPHAAFTLQVVLEMLAWNMRCSSDRWVCRNAWYTTKECAKAVLTTRGRAHDILGGHLWFITRMYWSILFFPLFHFAMRRLSPALVRVALVISVVCATALVPLICHFHEVPPPFTLWVWTFTLWSGMLAWQTFQQDGRSPQRKRLWGAITDLASVALLGVFVAAYLDTCMARPEPGNIFKYDCRQLLWLDFKFKYNMLKNVAYWNGRSMMWMSVFRLVTPVMALWIYGLSVGEGCVARFLSRPLLAQHLAPLAYNVFVMQITVAWYYWYLTRGLQHHAIFEKEVPRPIQMPVPMGESVFMLILTFGFSWFYDRHMSIWMVPMTVRALNLATAPMARLLTQASVLPSADDSGRSALVKVQKVVWRLTGTEFGPEARLEHLNLDSFGTAALVGMLRAGSPHLTGLRPDTLPGLGTVGALADFVEAQNAAAAAKRKAA